MRPKAAICLFLSTNANSLNGNAVSREFPQNALVKKSNENMETSAAKHGH